MRIACTCIVYLWENFEFFRSQAPKNKIDKKPNFEFAKRPWTGVVGHNILPLPDTLRQYLIVNTRGLHRIYGHNFCVIKRSLCWHAFKCVTSSYHGASSMLPTLLYAILRFLIRSSWKVLPNAACLHHIMTHWSEVPGTGPNIKLADLMSIWCSWSLNHPASKVSSWSLQLVRSCCLISRYTGSSLYASMQYILTTRLILALVNNIFLMSYIPTSSVSRMDCLASHAWPDSQVSAHGKAILISFYLGFKCVASHQLMFK